MHYPGSLVVVAGQHAFIPTTKPISSEVTSSRWNSCKLTSYMQQREIEWRFNPPGASHMGGVWERLIRSVRRILNNILTSHTISDDFLATIFAEVESIMNSRPLTPVSVDSRDGEPTTPNHLLNVTSNYNLPPGIFRESDIYAHNRWRQVQYVTDQFWSKWVREYMPLLLPRQKWNIKNPNYKIGDVVLVVDQRFPKRC